MAEEKKIGAVLNIADSVQRREIKEWRERVGELQNYCLSLVEQFNKVEDHKERAEHFRQVTLMLYKDIDESTRGWTRTKEELEARKSYMDLQAKIIEAWPRPATAERLFYVGTGFLGAGGVAYAYLGAGDVLAYLFLWAVGIGCLIGSVLGLWRYDKNRATYFAEIRGRLS